MGKKIIFLIFLVFIFRAVQAQDSGDTTAKAVSVINAPSLLSDSAAQQDSVPEITYPSFLFQQFPDRDSFAAYLLDHNMLFSNTQKPEAQFMRPVKEDNAADNYKTALFYLLLGVCFLLAVIRFGFRKYLSDLFSAFFSPTLSRRQLKDQLRQMAFPALALNIFFTVSGGLFLYLALLHTGALSMKAPFYIVAFFMLALMLIYGTKYIILRIGGWLFGLRELMDNYIFTLYLINKVLGIILLPAIILIAFSTPFLSDLAFSIATIFVVILFIYRYIRTFPMIKSSVSVNKFHFFLYLCALEIAPILIIGKLMLMWLNGA